MSASRTSKVQPPTTRIRRSRLASRLQVRCGLLVASLLLSAFAARATDTNAVLNGWLATQTNLQSWSADFTQTRTLKVLTRPLLATGHLWFAPPNRFRWELQSPSQTIALRDADEMWVIYPKLRRAERYPVNAKSAGEWRDALALLEAGFPRTRADLEARFKIRSLTETNGTWQLELQPNSAFARKLMQEVVIGLATNDYTLKSTEMVFVDGSRMRNDFTNGVMNSGFDASVFQWKPTPEFKVVEPLGQ